MSAARTPTFYINGRVLSGARPIEDFKKRIDEELAIVEPALRNGAKLETYYSDNVVRLGKACPCPDSLVITKRRR